MQARGQHGEETRKVGRGCEVQKGNSHCAGVTRTKYSELGSALMHERPDWQMTYHGQSMCSDIGVRPQ